MLHEPLDRAALAGGVTPLEENHDPLAGLLDPGLQLEQLHLQLVFLFLVALAREQILIRVPTVSPAFGEFFVGASIDRAFVSGRVVCQNAAEQHGVFRRGPVEDRSQGIGHGGYVMGRGAGDDVAHGSGLCFLCRGNRLLDRERFDPHRSYPGGRVPAVDLSRWTACGR